MRKIISIISLMLCMLVCLTACGEKNSNVDATKDSQPQGYVAMAEDEGGSTLVGVGFMLYDSKGTELTWLPMATNARGKVEFKDCKEPGCYVQVKTVPVGYTVARQFGMRSFNQDVASEPKGMFYLNGEPIRLRGANTMGFEQLDVMRDDYDQLIDDILLAKVCNMNFWRITQRPVQDDILFIT